MQRNIRAFASLIVCIACSFATFGVEAQTQTGQAGWDAEYEGLIDQALAAFEARDFPRARVLFEQAHARQPSARTLRGLGVTAVELRNYENAEDELEAALADHRRPLTPAQRREVTEVLEWMQRSLGTLNLTLSPPSAIARIDDRRTAGRTLRLDPGEHALEVRADGYLPHIERFALDRGQELSLRVDLAVNLVAHASSADPQPAPATTLARGRDRDESSSVFERWWFWAAVGVVVTGGVVTVVALTRDPGHEPFETGGVDGVLETLRVHR
jgi:hypothetical protein